MARKQRRHPGTAETTLYPPVKRYLEALGFTVKGEVCGCDLVALRGDEPPIVVIGELKAAFSLELVLQGVNRATACDEVWLAVPVAGGGGRVRDPRVHKLCRFLGFGLLGGKQKAVSANRGRRLATEIANFCNKIGTLLPIHDVRAPDAIGG
jgi:hypothetical protein